MSIIIDDKERNKSRVTTRVLREQIKKFQNSIDNLTKYFQLYKEQSQKNCTLRKSAKSKFSSKNEAQKIHGKYHNFRGNKRPEKILKRKKLLTSVSQNQSSLEVGEPQGKFHNLNYIHPCLETYENIRKKNSGHFLEMIYNRKIVDAQKNRTENKNYLTGDKSNKNNNHNNTDLFDNSCSSKNTNFNTQQKKKGSNKYFYAQNNGSLQNKIELHSENTLTKKKIEQPRRDFKIDNYRQSKTNANSSIINNYGERKINQPKEAQKRDNTKKTFYCVVNSPYILAQKPEWKWKCEKHKDKANNQTPNNYEDSKNIKHTPEITSRALYADETKTKGTNNKMTQTEQLDLLVAKCRFIDYLLNLLRKNNINPCFRQNSTPVISSKFLNADFKDLNNLTISNIDQNLPVGLKASFLKLFTFNKKTERQTLNNEKLMTLLNAGRHYSNDCCIKKRSIGTNTDNKQTDSFKSYNFQSTSKQTNKISEHYLKERKSSLAKFQQFCDEKFNYKLQKEIINEHKFGQENRSNKIYNWEQKTNNFKLEKSLKSMNVLQARRDFRRSITTKNYLTNTYEKKQTGIILKQLLSSNKLNNNKAIHSTFFNSKNNLNETLLGPIKNQVKTLGNNNDNNVNSTINSSKNNYEIRNNNNNGKEFINKNILLTKSIPLGKTRKNKLDSQIVNHNEENSNQTNKPRFHNICRSKIIQAVTKVSKLNILQNTANQNNKFKQYKQSIYDNKTSNPETGPTRIHSKEKPLNLPQKLSKSNIRNFSTENKQTKKLNGSRVNGIYADVKKENNGLVDLLEPIKCTETNIKKNVQNTEKLLPQNVQQKQNSNVYNYIKANEKNPKIRNDLRTPINSSELKMHKHSRKTDTRNDSAIKKTFEKLENGNISTQVTEINNDKSSLVNTNTSLQENVTINIIMNNQNYDKNNIKMEEGSKEPDLSEKLNTNKLALTRREKSSKNVSVTKNKSLSRTTNRESWRVNKNIPPKQSVKKNKINSLDEDKKINIIGSIKNNKNKLNEAIFNDSQNYLSSAFKRSDKNIFEINENYNEVQSKSLSYNSDSSKDSDDISGVWLNSATDSFTSLEYSNTNKNITIITNNSYKPSNDNLCWKTVRYHDAEIVKHKEQEKKKSFFQALKSWFQ